MTDQSVVQAHPRKVVAGGALAALAAIVAISTPLIQRSEGTIQATYLDPTRVLTACTGHTGPDLKLGQKWTLAQCTGFLDADQTKAIRAIGACTKVAVPVESFAAFTSFSFNAGPGPYCTKFAPLVNTGHLGAACARLSLYVFAGKKKLPGLVTRRARERALCEKGLG